MSRAIDDRIRDTALESVLPYHQVVEIFDRCLPIYKVIRKSDSCTAIHLQKRILYLSEVGTSAEDIMEILETEGLASIAKIRGKLEKYDNENGNL